MLPSIKDDLPDFYKAISMLQGPVEKLFEQLKPRPSCIISDNIMLYTSHIAKKFHIPRINFHGVCCFFLLCMHNVSQVHDNRVEQPHFVVPNLPDQIEFTKGQLPFPSLILKEFREKREAAALASYWVIVNTFEELEPAYVKEYKKARNDKVWCIGPVSLCNKDEESKAERGNKASIDEQQYMEWLNKQEPNSVVYACLGSLCNLGPTELLELGLGLEASQKPFIWVIRKNTSEELEKLILEDGFEERTKERGLVIRGWAPQVLILSHPVVGGFLTHCGWNSTLEGVSASVPLITWPLSADQCCNEKLVVQLLKIGVRVGGEEEKFSASVKKEDVKKAVEKLMDGGKESVERRIRAKELGKMAKKAVEKDGSSSLNITLLVQDIMQQELTNSPPMSSQATPAAF